MDFDAQLAEIEQQAQAKAARPEVIGALRGVYAMASTDALGYSVQRDLILAHLRFPILAPDVDRESLPER